MFSAVSELESNYQKLVETVAYKEDLEGAKKEMQELMDARVKKMKKWVRELQEQMVSKDDFIELVTRVDSLELDKVSREELGRLCNLSPKQFIDDDVEDIGYLRYHLRDHNCSVDKWTFNCSVDFLIVQLTSGLLIVQLTSGLFNCSVSTLEQNLEALVVRIDDEILPAIQAQFDEIRTSMAEMKEKLDTLDADDVLIPFILLTPSLISLEIA
ncbi:uncharacterized protein CEXT_283801 [Caerostris extrusa]|uniref:Uncharacterized protein n=1 Tax=Caerostris extrusa TaxID=172846 RepID=A0AAV4NMG9_CAEEX|nr:uncharacterized protein CEXT_283801 [Caerostris extrusa]